MNNRLKKIIWMATHPIQYQVPLLQEFAKVEGTEFKALFLDDFSVRSYVDEEFGKTVEWENNLLEGYNYDFLNTGGNLGKISFTKPISKGLFKYLRKEKPEAVIIQGWQNLGMVKALIYTYFLGIKCILRCEATDHVDSASGLKGFLRKLLVSLYIKRCDYFLYIGTKNKEFYLSRGVKESQLIHSPYCIDNKFYFNSISAEKNSELRKSYNLNDDDIVVIYVGKLIKRKFADILCRGFTKVKNPKMKLVVVGDGELMADLKNIEDDRIQLLGFKGQSELASLYNMSDVFILPAKNETWGLVVNEAMCCKNAIVVTKHVGSGYDLVSEGKNGYVMQSISEDSVTNVLSKFETHEQVEEMKNLSHEIISNWGIKENVNGFRQLVDKLKD